MKSNMLTALCLMGVSLAFAGKPNIVFILGDDMPWFSTPERMDPALPESASAFIAMPNVQRLAGQGMIFRNARAAAGMCAPSRCSIQTGMMAAHHLYSGNGGFGPKTDGNVKYIAKPTEPLLTPEPQGNIRFPSMGDILKSNGYATAHFGKWHLYGGGPEKHGYDESDGETDNKSALDPLVGATTDGTNPKQIFSITRNGLAFMEKQAKAGQPFFLQLSHYANHGKFEALPETIATYEKNPVFASITDKRERSNIVTIAAMSENLDTSIGMVLEKLEELGIAHNTYVVFTTDNGHTQWNEGRAPLRGDKWWLWDCGVRVPLIVRGPGIAARSSSDLNVVGYDFLPTFADLAGALDAVPGAVDGVSFKPLLLGQPVPEGYADRPIYFHYPHYRVAPPSSAIVINQMKLMYFYDHPEKLYLFDLAQDLGETTNLAAAYPEKAARMHQQLMDGLNAVGAYFPKPNPAAKPGFVAYDPDNHSRDSESANEKANAAAKQK